MKPEAQRQGNQNMLKYFISWFLKSLQSSSPTHDNVLYFYMVGLWDYVFMYMAYMFTFIIYSDFVLWVSYMFQFSTKQKDLTTTTKNNQFMVWMENNLANHEV